MAIPSGTGSEVLKSKLSQAVSTTHVTIADFSVDDHIYTCLSIIFSNNTTSAAELNLALYAAEHSGADHYLSVTNSIPAKSTFVWNDKFVVNGSGTFNYLVANFNTSTDFDILCTYIDQDWTTP